jgi:hypothetical protein
MIIGRKKFQYLKPPAGNVARTFPGLQQQIPRLRPGHLVTMARADVSGLNGSHPFFFLIYHIPAHAQAFARVCACGKSGGFIERCCLSSRRMVQHGSLA